jgi:hypothetical protein
MADEILEIPSSLQEEFDRLAGALNIPCYLHAQSTANNYMFFMEEAVKAIKDLNSNAKQAKPADGSKGKGMSKEELKFLQSTKMLEDDLRQTLAQTDEKLTRDEKLHKLYVKFNKEKEQRYVLETFIESQNKKITVLVQHIEKLMKNIKIESSKRIKALEDNRNVQKEEFKWQEKLNKMQRFNNAQSR